MIDTYITIHTITWASGNCELVIANYDDYFELKIKEILNNFADRTGFYCGTTYQASQFNIVAIRKELIARFKRSGFNIYCTEEQGIITLS